MSKRGSLLIDFLQIRPFFNSGFDVNILNMLLHRPYASGQRICYLLRAFPLIKQIQHF